MFWDNLKQWNLKFLFFTKTCFTRDIIRGDIVRGDIGTGGYCPGGFCPGGILSGGILSGGYCPGGYCPDTKRAFLIYQVFSMLLTLTLLVATLANRKRCIKPEK